MPESEPFTLNLDLSWVEDDEGTLIVSGCASVPEPDSENEIVTKEAIEAALPDFMELSVLHLDHTERPVGVIKESWFEGDKFMIRGPIKRTDDCRDVRNRIKSNELGQFSIFGRRIKGTPSCRLNPAHRSETCKTTAFYLDSVSICPKGNAINGNSYLEHNGGGIVVKATESADSAMIHTTADGTEEIKKMDEIPAAPGDSGSEPDALQKILDAITGLSNGLADLSNRVAQIEQNYEELTNVDPEDVQKADEGVEDGGSYDDAGDEGPGEPDLTEFFSAVGDALQMILSLSQEILKRVGDGGGEVEKADLKDEQPAGDEPEDDGYEDEDDLEKGCVKKATEQPAEPAGPDQSELLKKALERIESQEKDLDILRKSVCELNQKLKPRETVVVSDMVKKAKTGDSGDINAVSLAAQMYGV